MSEAFDLETALAELEMYRERDAEKNPFSAFMAPNHGLKVWAEDWLDAALAEVGLLQAQWVSVEERMPQNGRSGRYVLCAVAHGTVVMGWYVVDAQKWVDTRGRQLVGVTHWMLLPKPPVTL